MKIKTGIKWQMSEESLKVKEVRAGNSGLKGENPSPENPLAFEKKIRSRSRIC
jgi:hypothetical protein